MENSTAINTIFWDGLERIGYMFYLVSPNKTTCETLEEVPEYTVKVAPCFVSFIVLEYIILKLQRKPSLRINDTITNLSHGMLAELFRMLTKTWLFVVYIYIYANWRLLSLPWDSLWTWWISLLAVDFFYYWSHRLSHEINFLWAIHQVHHSSEDFNLTAALRQPLVQVQFNAAMSLPLALAVPPGAFLVHANLNAISQFWIHSKVITSVGPLEFILNTPSHHRVHHGRNRYCIDKNYGGFLIIWDRLFGTFESEKEEVFFGVTHPINTFVPFYTQTVHFEHIWRRFWELQGWQNKLSIIFKGPGWSPGKSRLGNIEDIPEVEEQIEKYDPPTAVWLKMYLLLHFSLLLLLNMELMQADEEFPRVALYSGVVYQFFSLCVIGTFFDRRCHAPVLELVRCVSYLTLDVYFMPYTSILLLPLQFQFILLTIIRTIFVTSALFWMQLFVRNMTITVQTVGKKVD